ncbi:MAG: hypothetical protein WA634_04140 [Silvibacterium sp.]
MREKDLNTLAIPLSNSQIEAASKFWQDGGWEAKELTQLKQVFPKSEDAVKLKAVALNTLYGTNIIAISRVAECLERMLNANHSTGYDLVEELVAAIKNITNRRHYSFAAKFGHFFINPELPILDKYAEWMVAKHLGSAQSNNPKRYLKFAEDIERLKELTGLNCDCAQLDAYLWVAGEYWCWKKDPKLKISTELKRNFERLEQNPENEHALGKLLERERLAALFLPKENADKLLKEIAARRMKP